jgi:hypothetical protein
MDAATAGAMLPGAAVVRELSDAGFRTHGFCGFLGCAVPGMPVAPVGGTCHGTVGSAAGDRGTVAGWIDWGMDGAAGAEVAAAGDGDCEPWLSRGTALAAIGGRSVTV